MVEYELKSPGTSFEAGQTPRARGPWRWRVLQGAFGRLQEALWRFLGTLQKVLERFLAEKIVDSNGFGLQSANFQPGKKYLPERENLQPGRRVMYWGEKLSSRGKGLFTWERKFPAGEKGYSPESENSQPGRRVTVGGVHGRGRPGALAGTAQLTVFIVDCKL